MTTQAEEQVTPVSSEGGDGFRVVLMVTVGLVVAGAIASFVSFVGSPFFDERFSRAFPSSLQRLMTVYSVSMPTFVTLIPLVALAVIALRGLRQFPWLGWVLPGYIFLLGLNGFATFFTNSLFLLEDGFPRPDLQFLFSVVLMVLGLVLFLIRPRPPAST